MFTSILLALCVLGSTVLTSGTDVSTGTAGTTGTGRSYKKLIYDLLDIVYMARVNVDNSVPLLNEVSSEVPSEVVTNWMDDLLRFNTSEELNEFEIVHLEVISMDIPYEMQR